MIKGGLIIIGILAVSLGLSPFVFSASSGSSIYDATLISFYGGGSSSALSSTNFSSPYSLLGETPAAPDTLSSTAFNTYVSVLKLIAPAESSDIYKIGNLMAKTDTLGQGITESAWQADNSPYFYWSILTQPPELVTGFSFSLDSSPDDEVDTASTFYQYPQDGISDGKHIFYVKPFGGDLWGDAVSFNIWVDTAPPAINSSMPQPGAVIKDSAVEVYCHISDASSGVNSLKTSMSINGSQVSAIYEEATGKLSFNAGGLPEGSNTVFIKAEDIAGNDANKSWSFTKDTAAPLGAVLINAGDDTAYSPYVILDLAAEDDTTSVVKVYISNDGVFDDEFSQAREYSSQIKGWLLKEPDKDGLKTVYVIFEDAAGNRSEAYSASITLRLLTPDTRIISAPPGITQETGADFIYEASKPGCVFSFRLDDAQWSGWASAAQASFSGLAEGNHYFLVKSAFDLDSDGVITIDEEDATPAQWVWAIGEAVAPAAGEETLFWKRQ
ncbi:MAG: hypothetical protein PHR44_01355 [Candidatus Omnitrophica bacterium]|nr:hypothetical protein [Candidatus Omnitrophota bacterium]